MKAFHGRLLVIGYGGVAQCVLPLLFRHINIPKSHVTVIDLEDKSVALAPWIQEGVTHLHLELTKENLLSTLEHHVGLGDIVLDLAWNIGILDLLQWCHTHDVMYLNTSVEEWDPYTDAKHRPPVEKTLYHRHQQIKALTNTWTKKGATALLEHGANPGLISHMVKQGLIDIAQQLFKDGRIDASTHARHQSFIQQKDFAALSESLGIKVIHVAERDSQISNVPKAVHEFVNTWSVEGLREEGTTTAELGWGTHERVYPETAILHASGPRHQICLNQMGMNTMIQSHVPSGPILGMLIRHGEAYTLPLYLSRYENGECTYRPTVHYAYCPSDATWASLVELKGQNYQLQPKMRIMNDDIVSGVDELGALLMGHSYQSWWVGSALSIEQSRVLVPHQNATTVQVAISVMAGLIWMIDHPLEGVCSPEDLPHDVVLAFAKPYLGDWISKPIAWNPTVDRDATFPSPWDQKRDEDPWQFHQFLRS